MECENCNNNKFLYNFLKAKFIYCSNCNANTNNIDKIQQRKKRRKKYKSRKKIIPLPKYDMDDPNLFLFIF
tara:strand:+ start:279 stop:491 length:213 start_codon:yes stop_codon:yes gene_type:complete